MTRLALLSALLVACSGSSGADIPSTPEPVATASLEDAAAPAKSVEAEQDAGSTPQDSGLTPADAGQEASVDAGQDSAPEPTRYGVRFDGSPGRMVADLPADSQGQATWTLEGYFRYDASSSEGLLFSTPGPYCAVATTGTYADQLACCWTGGSPCVYSHATFTIGVWHHVALILDAGSMTVYMDGQERSSVPGAPSFPAVNQGFAADGASRLGFGQLVYDYPSSKTTVDEFRVSFVRRYNANFTPPKHLYPDAQSKMALLLDDGAGVVSGQAALYEGASWITVTR